MHECNLLVWFVDGTCSEHSQSTTDAMGISSIAQEGLAGISLYAQTPTHVRGPHASCEEENLQAIGEFVGLPCSTVCSYCYLVPAETLAIGVKRKRLRQAHRNRGLHTSMSYDMWIHTRKCFWQHACKERTPTDEGQLADRRVNTESGRPRLGGTSWVSMSVPVVWPCC